MRKPAKNKIKIMGFTYFSFIILLSSTILSANIIKNEDYAKYNECNLEYDLVIISPSVFCSNLQKLVNHKNNINVKTKLVTIESIYDIFEGRDKPEKIKYFIKYALEEWNISYVLFIGDIYKIPIRITYSSIWPMEEEDVISDHYYADIYNENGSFCTWDANENNKFGEILIKNDTGLQRIIKCIDCWNIVVNVTDIDGVDLYPDVAIGRLPCSNKIEVNTVVNKIINYEKNTYDKSWFNNIVLAGGDTHPELEGIEGEISSEDIINQLPGFNYIKLYASENNLSKFKFNRAINNGVGFVSYSGHGTENGWMTHPPYSKKWISYHSPNIYFLKNKNKLPIIFFDACLTSKIDYNFDDFVSYKPFLKILKLLPGINGDTSLSCIAWNFVKHGTGGAIATVGATRSSYGYAFNNSSFAGYDCLNIQFFKAYKKDITLGEMFIKSQKEYLDNVTLDYMTIEEYILIGDPSLKVGGHHN